MRYIILTLTLLFTLSSFGQLDSNGNEYRLSAPTLDFKNYPVVVNSAGVKGLAKKNLIKELKCDTIAFAGRKYTGIAEVVKQDIIPIVVSFDVNISGKVTNVIGSSIADSSIAKNLLDNAKVGDIVIFSDVVVSIEGEELSLRLGSYLFEIIPYVQRDRFSRDSGSLRGKGLEFTLPDN
tara:strand:- start:227 stop:763 length:537 start_codon:yes stop_codon:yes gene_type:complete